MCSVDSVQNLYTLLQNDHSNKSEKPVFNLTSPFNRDRFSQEEVEKSVKVVITYQSYLNLLKMNGLTRENFEKGMKD
jgi:hypothetical protein